MRNRRPTKGQSDVAPDPNVAHSRANRDGDGGYVGRASSDADADSTETGAEARARKH